MVDESGFDENRHLAALLTRRASAQAELALSLPAPLAARALKESADRLHAAANLFLPRSAE